MLDGVFVSDAYGTVVLRRDGNRIRGVYRTADGFVRGDVGPDGVFRGAWCEGSQRPARRDAGILEWRLIETKSGEALIDGSWQLGYERASRRHASSRTPAGTCTSSRTTRRQDLQDRLAAEPESSSATCR